MAVEDGVEGLEFYKDSLRLLKLAYELTDTLPDYENSIYAIKYGAPHLA